MKIDRNGCIGAIGSATGVLLAAFALASPSQAQIGVYIGSAPPAVRYEARPPAPGPGYVWINGYYQPQGNHYRWHQGYWQQPPYQGAYYVHPHYDHYQEGWAFHDGYWSKEEHDDHHWDNRRDRDDHRDRNDHSDDHRDDHRDRDRDGH